MSLLRNLLFDNLGLKLAALVLAVVVYLSVFTERQVTMMVSFPFEVTDLADTLSLVGELPPPVQAELRGTGKKLVRLWLTEPRIKISLAGVGAGRFRRVVTRDDLPLMAGDQLEVLRLAGSTELDVVVARKTKRFVAVAARIQGTPRSGSVWPGSIFVEPDSVLVTGPRPVIASMDSVRLQAVSIEGRRDTVHAFAQPESLPDWCSVVPPTVSVTVPLNRP